MAADEHGGQAPSPNRPDDRQAMAALAAVRPRWCAVRPAGEAVGLPPRTLLHAGPPYAHGAQPAAPVLSSAALVCVHEGWAASIDEAVARIVDGEIALRPAQSHGVVLPLASVAGPRTALVGVGDGEGPPAAWSLLGSGAGPQIRFGTRDPAILARLRWRDEVLAARLHALVSAAPPDLLALAHAGLSEGDDLHASTSAAQAALNAELLPRLGAAGVDGEIAAMLSATPLFFLTLWMAACHLMLEAAARAADGSASTLVVALAGNGRDLGVRLAGQPRRWFVSPAPAPAGPRIDPSRAAPVSPMVGDSGVIDAAGFGAQALALAPAVREALAGWLPPDWRERPARLAQGSHPVFADLGLGLGTDAAAGTAPLAAIAMVGGDGLSGLLGRGIVQMEAAVFTEAARALKESTIAG